MAIVKPMAMQRSRGKTDTFLHWLMPFLCETIWLIEHMSL